MIVLVARQDFPVMQTSVVACTPNAVSGINEIRLDCIVQYGWYTVAG